MSLTAVAVLTPVLGLKPRSRMRKKAATRATPSMIARSTIGHAEAGHLGHEAAEHRAAQHGHAADGLATAEDGLEVALEAGGAERIDQPGLRGAAEEGEAETEQHGGQGPADEWAPRSAT